MDGFDSGKVINNFSIPDDYDPAVILAIGEKTISNEVDILKQSELNRLPIKEILFEEKFGSTSDILKEKNELIKGNEMNKIIYRSEDRGKANYGWLDTKYSFSFANYYNQDMMNFGLLRVLNNDIVEPGMGFGTHPHNNMEIVTIILDGALEHKDSMGTGSVIHKDEVQVMSAGSGITHSEFNPSQEEKVNLLQIWIFPKEKNIKPRYEQNSFPTDERKNKLVTAVSGLNKDGSLYIHQNAEINLGNFDKGQKTNYKLNNSVNGVYIYVIDGQLSIADEELFRRDAIGIYNTEEITIDTKENSRFIIIEVPMN
ncbi:MAG: pirin family protein [Ignavibacteriaceae bacterium]